jgi:hypothetical protein
MEVPPLLSVELTIARLVRAGHVAIMRESSQHHVVLRSQCEIREAETMSELHELHQAWERADARLHAHLAHHHRSHLSNEHQARVSNMETEMGDDILGDRGELEAAAGEAQATYGAYTMALHGLGQGMG